MAHITLDGVTVAYPVVISNRQQSAFANAAHALSFGRYGRGVGVDHVVAIDDLTLNLPRGTRIGLIGRNGSGKSTLLKTCAGIITPAKGRIDINGTVGCLLGLGAGLEVDKSGIDNMQLIGRFHGLRGADLKDAVAEAAEFTELGPFLHMPVRTYSTGMMARLAFAIATAQHSDIMLIDEVIATGDAHFINKAVDRVRTVCANSGVTLVASHMPNLLADFCDEAIWMHAGKVQARGPVLEVWDQYAASVN
ncbi:ATP-binding cassette domain-containing protein [Caulobacter sp. 73W]|uniref:ATP-binding cassette domain-containing protein n=1 Tax=Caulobacter sp. 73W TaxID=3161137 RepID=A0AB39KWY6_9CAUL